MPLMGCQLPGTPELDAAGLCSVSALACTGTDLQTSQRRDISGHRTTAKLLLLRDVAAGRKPPSCGCVFGYVKICAVFSMVEFAFAERAFHSDRVGIVYLTHATSESMGDPP